MGATVFVFAGVRVADSGRELGLGAGGGHYKSRKNEEGWKLVDASHCVPVLFFEKFATSMFATAELYAAIEERQAKSATEIQKVKFDPIN
jgi:hypothetical protein